MKLTAPNSGYYAVADTKGLKESMMKWRMACDQAAKEAREQSSRLPKDWRNRTFRGGRINEVERFNKARDGQYHIW